MTGAWEPISCFKYEELRANPAMRVHSACTNYVGGSDLACWCPLDQPCHADVLLEIANRGEGA